MYFELRTEINSIPGCKRSKKEEEEKEKQQEKNTARGKTARRRKKEKEKGEKEEAKQKGRKGKDESFQFVDLNQSGSVEQNVRHFNNQKSWVKWITSKVNNAKIVGYDVRKTPLKKLKRFGESLVETKLPGQNHHLHHRYIILRLEDNDRNHLYMSLDKGQHGIVAQTHHKYDNVAGSFLGIREKRTQKIKASR